MQLGRNTTLELWAALVTALALVPNGPAHAVFPGVNGKIAFTASRDGTNQIYIMSADVSGQTNLSSNVNTDILPAWSPDGTRISFDSDRPADLNDDIYVMNANDMNPINLSDKVAQDFHSDWLPDGAFIAFRSDRDGYFQIYVMNANGTGQTNISNSGTHDTQPTWQVAPDTDHDGLPDEADNCTLVANPTQCDSDADGYGNRCDGDLNNNSFTNAQDQILFRALLGKSSGPSGLHP